MGQGYLKVKGLNTAQYVSQSECRFSEGPKVIGPILDYIIVMTTPQIDISLNVWKRRTMLEILK